MLVLRRIALPFINALIVTLCLLGLMYSLIYMKEPELNRKLGVFSFKPVSIPKDTVVKTITEKPIKPKEVKALPPIIKDPTIVEIDQPDVSGWGEQPIDFPKGDLQLPSDAQLTIAMGYQPVYPSSQAARGTEGFVVVGFSVSPAGEVFDAYIIESQPAGAFDRSALKAIKKFKYRARTVDGKPVSTSGQRYMFSYKLEAS